MKNIKKIGLVICALFCSFLFFSCKTELTMQLNKNGSVDIRFVAGAGKAFTQMLLAASDGEEAVFDVTQISYELGKAGFSKVKVEPKGVSDITVTMSDLYGKSFLFTSGVCAVENSKLAVNMDGPKLKKFYENSDEMLQMVLDLLLAPVFNDEVMEENEYLEVIGSFYGEAAADELLHSTVNIKIIQPDGKKTETTIPMVKILTLNSPLGI